MVSGILSAGSATGQLVFLPPTAWLATEVGWREASLVVAAGALGAGIATVLAGIVRDATGHCTVAWFAAAGLCIVAALVSLRIRRAPVIPDEPERVEPLSVP